MNEYNFLGGTTISSKLTSSENVPPGNGSRGQLPATDVTQTSQLLEDTSCIQVAVSDTSPNKNSPTQLNSTKMLCGSHPKKVTIIVTLVLSIWASFVLGINIQKKVPFIHSSVEILGYFCHSLRFYVKSKFKI